MGVFLWTRYPCSADVSGCCAALPEEDQGRGRGIEPFSLRKRSERERASGGSWGGRFPGQAAPRRGGVLRAGCRPLCVVGVSKNSFSGVSQNQVSARAIGWWCRKDAPCAAQHSQGYRGTLLIRNCFLLGPYGRTMPRALRWSYWGGSFL